VERFTAAMSGLFSSTALQSAEKTRVSYQGIALQLAEKAGAALAFGWRSGLPLR
jgi:hypothetical protein